MSLLNCLTPRIERARARASLLQLEYPPYPTQGAQAPGPQNVGDSGLRTSHPFRPRPEGRNRVYLNV
jgi:hypothetical protein